MLAATDVTAITATPSPICKLRADAKNDAIAATRASAIHGSPPDTSPLIALMATHRDGGQAQYVDMPVPVDPEPDAFHDALAWAVDHLDEPLAVGDLAARALMSPRSFARRFRQVAGTSPHQWLLRQRVILAQRLLETTDEPVERIAQLVGMGSAATLRMHFQRIVQTTPLAYRRTFTCADVAEEATA